MDYYKVDYHIHTVYSDGKATPTEIIKKAAELEYDRIAITDHDNVNGLEEARIAAEALNMTVIPGIEIAVETEEKIGLHMLGYEIDPKNPELQDFLSRLIKNREERNEQLFEVLRQQGFDISVEDVEVGRNSFIGKPLIVRALLRKGLIKSEKEGFGPAALGSKACRSVKKAKPKACEAIEIIEAAGGIPVLAHPIQTRGIGRPGSEEFFENIEKIIRKLKTQGLKGLECYHPDQNEEQSSRFVEIAGKYHLHITRGSDFHGSDFAKAEKTADYR